ncbi:hypothetical protein A7P25_00055 [Achromobacter xylosoxidans]|nr:hypothetical protein A7P25_00055 [Achromobacter xylosoxidans]
MKYFFLFHIFIFWYFSKLIHHLKMNDFLLNKRDIVKFFIRFFLDFLSDFYNERNRRQQQFMNHTLSSTFS